MSGTGVYTEISANTAACKEWCEQLQHNSQLRDVLGPKLLGIPLLDWFFFGEHAFCGDRKYENVKTKLMVEASEVGGILSSRYSDAPKENEYAMVPTMLVAARKKT